LIIYVNYLDEEEHSRKEKESGNTFKICNA